MCFWGVGGFYQQTELLSWGEVGVAEVTRGLEHPDDPLHVTGETETVVGHDQQFHNCRRESDFYLRVFYLLLPQSDQKIK